MRDLRNAYVSQYHGAYFADKGCSMAMVGAGNTTECTIDLFTWKKMHAPVYVQYFLTDFYQNYDS